MGIKEKIMELKCVRDYILVSKFGNNIHDVDLLESIQTGVVNRLLIARELGIDYAVVVEGIVPMSKIWDKYGDGTWNPNRSYISTEDIKTEDNNREQEERNIYDFLRGKPGHKAETTMQGYQKTKKRKSREKIIIPLKFTLYKKKHVNVIKFI